MHDLWLVLPAAVQAIAIGCDELIFHRKRGLPLWERIGHPIDTLSVLACLTVPLVSPPTPGALRFYIACSILSCLLVTKDEWVHKEHCPGSEQWLHALLFLNHPVLLTGVGWIWWHQLASVGPLSSFSFLSSVWGGTFFFCCYQAFYWNVVWKPPQN